MKRRIFLLSATLVFGACATKQSPSPQLLGEDVAMNTQDTKSYENACREQLSTIQKMRAALESSTAQASVTSVLNPLNELWRAVDEVSNRAALLQQVHPVAGIRKAAESCEQNVQKIVTEIGLSRPIFDLVSKVDVSAEDVVTKRWVKNTLRDFKRSGVDKDEATRTRIKELKENLVTIGQEFSNNIRGDVREIYLDSVDELKGLPQDYITAHAPDADGKIKITTNYPDYIPFATYAENDSKRKELYSVFRSRGYPANESVLRNLIETRHELATLLGYDNWAQYITEDKMTGSDKVASRFIEKVNGLAQERSQRDYDALLAALRKMQPDAQVVGDWQKSFVSNRLKSEKFNFDPKAPRQYFQYQNVKRGILELTSELFGVEYKKVELGLWHDSVEAYDVFDSGEHMGRFYLDMHPRENKFKHAAAFPIRSGIEGVQLPEASLVCNFPSGEGLMEHAQVTTFFHEFGHLIHHLFGGKHRWVAVSGFNTEWDFVEAPSQLLEEWAWDFRVLKRFASNSAGDAIPEELVEKMKAASNFGRGLDTRHQMFYAALSMNYYNQDPSTLDLQDTMVKLQKKYSPFEYVDGTHFQYSFGHLDGYSAIYYTYMWSLVIAKDLFSRFEKEGVMNPEVAGDYRRFVLAPGGSVDAKDMVKNFLGRDYTFESFENWLNAN